MKKRNEMVPGHELIRRERVRHEEEEGWTAEHDDLHTQEELASAGAFYAIPEKYGELLVFWPFDPAWNKKRKHDRIRQLVIAGSFIAAEIDRLQRSATGTTEPTAMAPKEKWEPAITTGTLVAASCNGLLDTAARRQAGEIDSGEAFREVLASGLILAAVEETLAVWEPPADLGETKEAVQGHLAEIQAVLSRWLDEEISAADVPDLLSPTCERARERVSDTLATARAAGFSQSEVENLVEEMQATLEALATRFEGEAVEPPTPTALP